MERTEHADIEHADIEPGGRAAAPGRLALLQRFVNTWNGELPADEDRLATTRTAAAWLQESELVPDLTRSARSARLDPADVARLGELREAIRAIVVANVSGPLDPAAVDALRSAADAAPMTITVDAEGRTRLVPLGSGVHAAIANLLTIMHEAQLTGDWARLKGCRQCGYAFFDLSKNRSAAWCSMSICGNRAKNRAYYQRQQSSGRSTSRRA